MRISLAPYGLDRRFLELTAFVMIGTWVFLLVFTMGFALQGWHMVLIHQAVAWPFAVLGWAGCFWLAQNQGIPPRHAALFAGFGALMLAELGTAKVLNLWTGSGGGMLGLVAFPVLALLTAIGVMWLYRAETWLTDVGQTERTKA